MWQSHHMSVSATCMMYLKHSTLNFYLWLSAQDAILLPVLSQENIVKNVGLFTKVTFKILKRLLRIPCNISFHVFSLSSSLASFCSKMIWYSQVLFILCTQLWLQITTVKPSFIKNRSHKMANIFWTVLQCLCIILINLFLFFSDWNVLSQMYCSKAFWDHVLARSDWYNPTVLTYMGILILSLILNLWLIKTFRITYQASFSQCLSYVTLEMFASQNGDVFFTSRPLSGPLVSTISVYRPSMAK